MVTDDGRVIVTHVDVIQDARRAFATTASRRRALCMIALRSVGFTYADIGDLLGLSLSSARKVIIRNSPALRECLNSVYSAPPADAVREAEIAALLRDQQADDASDYVDYANAK